MKIHFTHIPPIIPILIYPPPPAIPVHPLKNLLHYLIQPTISPLPLPQLPNFIPATLFILPLTFIFKKIKSPKPIPSSIIIPTLLITLIITILNYFLFLPPYTSFLNPP
ncbi:ECF transporter S component, partial [Bacillus pumilus]|uniref:ECF transporter S component n=1 Tax=Bacillus pumilus TaxID=1408 RepID=UPI0021B28C7F